MPKRREKNSQRRTKFKLRTPVPPEIATDVLFLQNHTCCVCRESGKSVQLHHIDEDPSNHAPENLAALCLEDHERTQVKGGFGRKLLAPEVRRYRDDWLLRVRARREEADKIASAAMGGTFIPKGAEAENDGPWTQPPQQPLISYIKHLPDLRRSAYENARFGWDTGVTLEMRMATAQVIEIFERVLVYLSNWYPPHHFGEKKAERYFAEFVASRYEWHRSLHDPEGPGSGGTIAGVIAGGGTMADVERAVTDMVEALVAGEIDLLRWRKDWETASEPTSSLKDRLSEFWKGLGFKVS